MLGDIVSEMQSTIDSLIFHSFMKVEKKATTKYKGKGRPKKTDYTHRVCALDCKCRDKVLIPD